MKHNRELYKKIAAFKVTTELAAATMKAMSAKNIALSIMYFHKASLIEFKLNQIKLTPAKLFGRNLKLDKRRRRRYDRKRLKNRNIIRPPTNQECKNLNLDGLQEFIIEGEEC